MSLSITDKKALFQSGCLEPHYTDRRFKKPQTIFLSSGVEVKFSFGMDCVDDAEYVYSDRLFQWHHDRFDQIERDMKSDGLNQNTPEYFERFLQKLLNDPALVLVHILAGCNLANGYPYRIYGFIRGGV
ncbi:hypothetical protein H6761_01845 [Candidatus Nomurabacteria bacterium]|nr:hypothetical protein [Candidatus Nomurabacteria bacterium]